ncbi:hypothetical protein H4219_000903 [Mycoemilia scoparia]|uniref:YABBY protein C-terminal domain-containing protein n=1 Tax=Mycoemilia scoparia TaxID=417184 RepID=A0A9W8DW27_9FUNG|nr:hypothetical protein H4219_000903 [Mycoemilia scoparia]
MALIINPHDIMPRVKSDSSPAASKAKKPAAGTKTRKMSKYNDFMKQELVRVKQNNPNIAHKEAFKLAASGWKNSPMNPKNAKPVKA